MKEKFRIIPLGKAEFNGLEKKLYLKGGFMVEYENGEVTLSGKDEIVDAYIDCETGIMIVDKNSEFSKDIIRYVHSSRRRRLINHVKKPLKYIWFGVATLGIGAGIYKLIEYFSK